MPDNTFSFTTPQNQALAAALLRPRQDDQSNAFMTGLPQTDNSPAYGGVMEGLGRMGQAMFHGYLNHLWQQNMQQQSDNAALGRLLQMGPFTQGPQATTPVTTPVPTPGAS